MIFFKIKEIKKKDGYMSLENIFNWLKKLILQLISRYWWLFVFVALGFLTMEEWAHLIIPTD
jgi:hypothetical protein